MGLETKLVQKLGQSLLMTPQLQQAIKLLQLGRLEYKEAIEKELLENPILEELKEDENRHETSTGDEDASHSLGDSGSDDSASNPEPPAEPNAPTVETGEPKVDWEDYLDNYSDSSGAATPKGTFDFEDRPSLEATLTRAEDLVEHLLQQLRMSELTKDEEQIALNIIGNLNRDGYLCSTFAELATACGSDESVVAKIAQTIQAFDPPGVAARDLSECLLIQLEQQGMSDGLEARIVRNHLDKLENRKYDLIAKAENVAIEAVYHAVTTIQSLEPRPGRGYNDDTARYITPDVYVYKVGNEYVISLNEDGLPKLRVNPYYISLLRNQDGDNAPNKSYLNERLKAATWLIKSIHQRQQTIFRVAESIVKFQRDFLDHGISRMKPLVLKDVASDIGMHESTVSRVTTNKFVHTPQGVFELKYFFTTGIQTGEGEVSSSSIKEKIKNLIASEANAEPISDQQICEILKKDNIDIARRTVAKYREGLGILSSSKRKKMF